MLPKKNRLSRNDILLIKKEKIRPIYGNCFDLIYKKSELFKAGIISSNKIVGKACVRNKVKRLLFELLRKKEFKNGQFLFISKKCSSECVNSQFQADLDKFCKLIS
jgi:ribonuclease P protein component